MINAPPCSSAASEAPARATGLPNTAEHTFKSPPRILPSWGLQPRTLRVLQSGAHLGTKDHGLIAPSSSFLKLHQHLPKAPPSQAESTGAISFLGHEASTAGGKKGLERKTQNVTDGFDKSTRTPSSYHMWSFSKQSSQEPPNSLGPSCLGTALDLQLRPLALLDKGKAL